MKKIKTSIFLFFLLAPALVKAQGLVPCGGPGNPCNLCHLFELFSNIVTFMLVTVVPPVATLFLVYGGVLFYTAMGDGDKIKKARNVLTSVLIGIIIVYGAHFLVSMILNALGVVDIQWPNIDLKC